MNNVPPKKHYQMSTLKIDYKNGKGAISSTGAEHFLERGMIDNDNIT